MDSAKVNDIVVESKETELNDVVTEKVDENDSLEDDKAPTFGFTEPSWRTDFNLVVDGTKLYVAKLILSLASPVFDTMFQSEFKEKSCDELELPGKKLSDVIAFLRCIYPNTCAEINHDSALVILPLLEEYQALQHKPRCEAVLLDCVTEETTTDELLKLLKYACMYNLQKLRAKCISLISSRPYDELDHSYCKSFPSADALNEIFLNVNTSMKSKLAELEQVVKEYELLKKYISSEVIAKNFKDLKCDSENKWDDKTVILIYVVPAKNKESEGKVVDIWGIPIKICIKRDENKLFCEKKKHRPNESHL